MLPVTLIPLPQADKLATLQKLDQFRRWYSLDDKRRCLQCGRIFRGHDLEVVGGTRGLGPLRMQCPTPGCAALAIDLALPSGSAAPSLSHNPDRGVPQRIAIPADGVEPIHNRSASGLLARLGLARRKFTA